MSDPTFRIRDTVFRVPGPDLEATELVIGSVPRPYRVRLAAGGAVPEIRRVLAASGRARLLADEKVHRLHLGALGELAPTRRMLLEANELTKSLAGGVVPVIDWLAEAGMTKSDPLAVVGGGIVQDIGGFAALMFKRGLPWSYFPTTLLSMCDSCIGAKAGVNHGRYKNQLALFSAPREVVIDLRFLATLEPREVRSGLGEILKLHLTGGPAFAERVRAALDAAGGALPGPEALRDLIWASLCVKKAVIERDEFELDLRRALNYGHTVGHAIENLTGFAVPHGHAICAGMAVVNRVAANRGLMAARDHDAALALIDRILDPDTRAALGRLDVRQLRDALARDKKTTGSTLNLVVMREVGRLDLVAVENDDRFAAELGDILAALARDPHPRA